jgi:hypothetical protein
MSEMQGNHHWNWFCGFCLKTSQNEIRWKTIENIQWYLIWALTIKENSPLAFSFPRNFQFHSSCALKKKYEVMCGLQFNYSSTYS